MLEFGVIGNKKRRNKIEEKQRLSSSRFTRLIDDRGLVPVLLFRLLRLAGLMPFVIAAVT
ncbi:hypothetical protein EPI10_024074 [Gossypium australe]|uniref:Uncharacterized protein n=1 Tax=Gossypium australe TaxID=47621 RepID=A0A5B6VXI6_9ROSI|nr:hypothetical protein EPI10_024074 [Gossypium australe]